MRGSRSLGLALVAAALGAAPALAQQQNNAAPPANAPANTTMAPNTTAPSNARMANNENAAANAKGPTGQLEMYNGEWRTSKVVGATVFNSNGDSIGTVDDLLMNSDGSVKEAVISTGGGAFGIGSKLVAVPFNQLKFEPSVNNNNAAAPAAANPNTPANTTAARMPNTPAANNPPANAPARAAENQGHPTYYSLVMPNETKDSLAKAQTFKYASSG
jgi:sporulation protein YlmC with PRC-barrel domain